MKRLILGVAITSALGLTGCGEDSTNELIEKATPLIPVSHMVFDPANGKLPVPNDLLFSGTNDGTINMPNNVEAAGNYVNPQIAIGALDGWSTTSPISIDIKFAKDHDGTVLTLDTASVAQAGAVRVFEATVGGALSGDPECKAAAASSACKVGAELVYGVDFISVGSGSKIAIIPLKPLKAKQSYIYATTKLIQDSKGRAIEPSETYTLVKLDIETNYLATPAQRGLQTLVNSYEKGMASEHGVDTSEITYSGLFTTQSVADVYETTKLLMASSEPYKPSFVQAPTPMGITVAQALQLPSAHPSYETADLADLYTATIRLPIYGNCSSAACVLDDNAEPEQKKRLNNSRWAAQFDSPLSVLLAVQNGTMSTAHFATQAIAQGVDPVEAQTNPALLAGKTFTLNDGTAADKTKHLTKFNPIPAIKGYENIKVQITLPNGPKLAAYIMGKGGTFVPPAAGWPTTIAMHGLGGGKEMALSYAGTYAAAGIATIAMDMPLHGERSFDANNDGIYEVTATLKDYGSVVGKPDAFNKGTILDFINIASSLMVRDNFRQATLDHLSLRLLLTGMAQQLSDAKQPQVFDVSKISVQGLSLGGIVGSTLSTYASTGLKDPTTGADLGNPFAINAASLVAPAGGLAGSFAGSASFAQTLFTNVTKDPTFIALVAEKNTAGYVEGTPEYVALVQAVYAGFIPSFALAIQTAVDSVDPVNHGAKLASLGLPVHLIEVVGDGADNKPDQTLPNSVAGFPLSGTEPFIRSLGLGCVAETTQGSGAVRFAKGHHSSIVDPSETSATDGMAAAATVEMQMQVAGFAQSAGMGTPTIAVTNPSVIASCGS
ncbi:VolA/Pla-1 family phospholipase [Shewanella sp. SR44-3]|uniref:VolA/Pla-1 family phospholipase n=1 Tax=Shewanella sp. SR44-3 TaxID=2760936 RepID=UPI0015FDE327|nr:VolA/Pla-1 family phospholipase [Shewanella sp. SR44-3]MBB1270202.1 lipase [Shewanella sp. SR44-3]